MTEVELPDFLTVFQRVVGVFPLRGEARELREVGASYFQAMRRFPLRHVDAGADRCIQQLKRFPKPAEWIDLIPRPSALAPVPELTADEAADWLEAERRRWEGRPCGCGPCRNANVSRRPLRFVPEFDADDQEVRARIGDRSIVRGHWAHGDELARYYAAKDKFWADFRVFVAKKAIKTKAKKRTFQQRIEDIFTPTPKPDPPPEREPGQEG